MLADGRFSDVHDKFLWFLLDFDFNIIANINNPFSNTFNCFGSDPVQIRIQIRSPKHTQVAHVLPYSAVQLFAYDTYKGSDGELSIIGRLAAGACAVKNDFRASNPQLQSMSPPFDEWNPGALTWNTRAWLICKEAVEENILHRVSQKSTVQQLVMTGGHIQGDILAPVDVISLLIDDAHTYFDKIQRM
ncbi:hypothetical protein L2E82_48472 [Cichorium intybus]|uniref:Uncharacterized protein n=1 Tax=Cichorium intybus TaxID=13427 RepID=A0ACB8YZC0_CICIN|nr:hypothetical protein L2E82_48472 [Cichorium intybus]